MLISPTVTEPGDGQRDRVDVRATLSTYRYGRGDLTTQLSAIDMWRATWTPADGPATVHAWWSHGRVDAEAWGPGASWLLDRIPAMTGAADPGYDCPPDAHPAISAAHRNHRSLRIGSSGALYHELLPVVLAQRVTSIEANRQWRQLTARLGEVAPGPNATLRLPPSPAALAGKPAWWYHPLGIEAKRADALRTVARNADRIHEWSLGSSAHAAQRLALLHGIGVWTIGSVCGPVFGDSDAVPVGDYHVKNMVGWALAGEPRATDERMLELLRPYAGQRGRVIALLGRDGHAAPKFGPRQRIQPMHRW